MLALISDIHANLEALEAVLRDIATRGCDDIWCMGDVLGYGPDPADCIDLIERNCSVALMGNHDWAVIHSPVRFNRMAARMIEWTKKWLEINEDSGPRERARWRYIQNLDFVVERAPFFLTHASPKGYLTEYLMPADVAYNPAKFRACFSAVDHHFMGGHTHMPCAITEDLEVTIPDGTAYEYELSEQKTYINPGSVGQPRDGDPRASYVIMDGDSVVWHRIPYPYEKTSEKIASVGDEYLNLARRLSVGR